MVTIFLLGFKEPKFREAVRCQKEYSQDCIIQMLAFLVDSIMEGHPTGVVNMVYGPNLPTPRNSCVIKRNHVYKFVNKPPYIDNKPTAIPSGEVIKIDTGKA